MNLLKKNINILFKGIYAGMMIGIGGTVYLSISNSIIGAVLFAGGLLAVCVGGGACHCRIWVLLIDRYC